MATRRLVRYTGLGWDASIASSSGVKFWRSEILRGLNPSKRAVIPGHPNIGSAIRGNSRTGAGWVEFTSRHELRGQGDASTGTSAEYTPEGVLFQACGMSVAGTTAFTYAQGDPHTDGDTPDGDLIPLTLKINTDGLQHICTSCVGIPRFRFAAGEIPTATIDWTGLPSSAASFTTPTADSTETAIGSFVKGPSPRSCQGVSFLASAASSLYVLEYEYGLGGLLDSRPSMNDACGLDVPGLCGFDGSGSFLMEVTAKSTFDPEEAYVDRTAIVISFTHNAGGATYEKIAVGQSIVLSEMPELVSLGRGRLGYRCPFEQYETSGMFTMVWS